VRVPSLFCVYGTSHARARESRLAQCKTLGIPTLIWTLGTRVAHEWLEVAMDLAKLVGVLRKVTVMVFFKITQKPSDGIIACT
jgi:hypothetical protein